MGNQLSRAEITPKQVAERISVHEQTLVVWRKIGCGPKFIRRGRRYFYRIEDVDYWYENGDPISASPDDATSRG